MDQSKVSNCGSSQLGIFLRLRGLNEFSRFAGKKKRLQNFPAQVRRIFHLIQLLELPDAMDQAKLADGFATERFVLLTLRRGKQALLISSQRSEEHTSELQSPYVI